MKKFLAIFTFLTIISGAVLMSLDFKKGQRSFVKKPENHLKLAIPKQIGDMVSKDLPIANTEEVVRATESQLSVSEWLNREYTLSDGRTFNLYISYWEPNKMEVRFSSIHTPDRCWVKNGWKNLSDKKRFNEIINVNGRNLMPAYYREYEYPVEYKTIHRNVWFWFIADGKRYTYGSSDNYFINPVVYIKTLINDAYIGAPEEYFVRIDSDASLYELLEDANFKALLEKLGELTLFEKDEADK